MFVLYFRLSLREVEAPDSFGILDPNNIPFTRESWLRNFFSEQRNFVHRGQEFFFIPEPDVHELPDHLIVGWIARSRALLERTPPQAGFQPTEHSSWRGALIVIDPTAHEDGQKIACEHNTDIGQPLSVLSSLVAAMSIGEHPAPFDATVFPIVEEASFWRFAERHNYQIKTLTFDVAPPNMFGGSEEFSSELRKLRDRNKVSRLKTRLQSDTVLDVKEQNIKEIVEYTEKGVGTINATTVDNIRYSSSKNTKHDVLDTSHERDSFWSAVRLWLGERF